MGYGGPGERAAEEEKEEGWGGGKLFLAGQRETGEGRWVRAEDQEEKSWQHVLPGG